MCICVLSLCECLSVNTYVTFGKNYHLLSCEVTCHFNHILICSVVFTKHFLMKEQRNISFITTLFAIVPIKSIAEYDSELKGFMLWLETEFLSNKCQIV